MDQALTRTTPTSTNPPSRAHPVIRERAGPKSPARPAFGDAVIAWFLRTVVLTIQAAWASGMSLRLPFRTGSMADGSAAAGGLFNLPSPSLRSGQIVEPEAEGVGETAQDGDGALLVAVLDGGQAGA